MDISTACHIVGAHAVHPHNSLEGQVYINPFFLCINVNMPTCAYNKYHYAQIFLLLPSLTTTVMTEYSHASLCLVCLTGRNGLGYRLWKLAMTITEDLHL